MSESSISIPSEYPQNNATTAIPSSPSRPTPAPKKTKRGPRGGVYDPFPMKVHRMLNQSKAEGNESVVSWMTHGRAFKIHQPKVFAEVIMPRFFNQSKYTSFQRQLNLYGFNRATRGRDAGAYYHDLFLRGKPSLATRLLRQKVKGSGHKTLKLLDKEPDFYSMPPLTDDPVENNLVPNVFAPNMSQYLPVTAVAPAPVIDPTPAATRQQDFLTARTVSSVSASSCESDSDADSHQNIPPIKPTLGCTVPTIHGPISDNSSANNNSFVNELNETIFMHELALGCSILCQLRRGNSNM